MTEINITAQMMMDALTAQRNRALSDAALAEAKITALVAEVESLRAQLEEAGNDKGEPSPPKLSVVPPEPEMEIQNRL